VDNAQGTPGSQPDISTMLVIVIDAHVIMHAPGAAGQSQALMPRQAPQVPKPKWHPPWKLYRVIAGHSGWVRCLSFDPTNQWFASGSNDRTIKVRAAWRRNDDVMEHG
jgi:WD40 repeat protein